MIPKTEPAENIPHSVSSMMCMDSIIKHLKSLERHFVAGKENAKNQLNIMREKNQQLESENAKWRKELEQLKSKMKSKMTSVDEQNSKLKSENESLKSQLKISTSFTNMAKRGLSKVDKALTELKTSNRPLQIKMKPVDSLNELWSDSEDQETSSEEEQFEIEEILDSKKTKM